VPIYKATIAGRKSPVTIKADSASKAREALVTLDVLSAKEVEAMVDEGAKPWKPGAPLPGEDNSALLQYLEWFRNNADFGPADGDVIYGMHEDYTKQTGNPVPEEYAEEEGD
jgi:hypothetical protein